VTLTGNPVVITQGPNILKGERLVVDLTTSFARVEGRVTGMFSTGGKDDKPGGLLGTKENPKGTQKPAVKNKPTALPGSNPSVTN
jgi:lipopolysaccharide export system protein LptA